jgi:glyoxylase-like metal-dependent hydrolase (beta-lactamase superfamily II)
LCIAIGASRSTAIAVLPQNRDFRPDYAVSERLSPLVRRVAARNPGPLTFLGTGTFIVGQGAVAVIDPGPDLAEHVEALLAALKGETVSHILMTHEHEDHAGAVPAFSAATGAPVHGFSRDHRIKDGDVIRGPGWTLEAIHTPGHVSNHLCFALAEEATIFSGDHVMGWSTTVIVPPDGDMLQYMDSLEKIMRRPEPLYRPTHGPEVPDGPAYTAKLLAHRRRRGKEVLAAVASGISEEDALLAKLYANIEPALLRPARATLWAHLKALVQEGAVVRDGDGRYRVR